MKALHDPQNCPHCGESISPILVGRIPQTYGAIVSNATCPKCGGKWLTQLNTDSFIPTDRKGISVGKGACPERPK